jgi:O-antigen ligase
MGYRQHVVLNRVPLARMADYLAVAVAASLPWSTSVSAIFIVLWLVAIIPIIENAASRRAFATPAAMLPLALFTLAAAGMLWADASWGERLGGIRGYLKLLIIPLAIAYSLGSERGYRVLLAYLASVFVLLLLSWATVMWPDTLFRLGFRPGFPVKDYVAQSGEFLLCAVALIYLALTTAAARQHFRTACCVLLASAFIANIVYVATSRTTVLILPLLLAALGARRFGWKGAIAFSLGLSLAAAAAWTSSPYLRDRIHQVSADIARYQADPADLTGDKPSSVGMRLEFWRRSVHLISQAPVFGNGTERLLVTFRSENARSTVQIPIANPHNQYLAVTIQLGVIGLVLLIATWGTHLALFCGRGIVAWCGFALVAQTMISSLFHSHLFDFTQGWTYAFGVGVMGGMVLRERLHRPTKAAAEQRRPPDLECPSSFPMALGACKDDPSVCLKIDAAIVIYRPDLATLSAVLAAVAPQVSRVLLIANDSAAPALALPNNAELVIQNRNLGLGAAYNLAVDWARANRATHLLLLDQDSVAERDMVVRLGKAFSATADVAAAGPLWRDARTGKTGHFVRLTRWGTAKIRPTGHAIVSVDFLISSGTLISLKAVDRIGPFDEQLFIEHVDTDWCLRARAIGYALLGVVNARLDHKFGDATLTAPLAGGNHQFFLYPAERNYYLVRNSIVLWRRPYAPMGWVLHDFLRNVVLIFWHILVARPRRKRLKSVWRGICDGLGGDFG